MASRHAFLASELPLIQAPMAGAQRAALAIAVCNAGGIGSLPCALLSTEATRSELTALRAGTDRPFNVNFFCHPQPQVDAERDARWRQALAPYFREFGIDPDGVAAGAGRLPFAAAAADLLDEFRPAIVSFHFGLPGEALLARARRCGARIIASATTVAEALWLERHGVDAVIAQGLEAGGHRGHFLSHDLTLQSGTFALLPQVVAAVRVPVIAAGGIADAAGVAAALGLGASAVQIGTAYLRCPEATVSALHRAALASEASRHTVLTNLFSGRPARGMVNRVIDELGAISTAPPEFPLAAAALAPLRAAAEAAGRSDFTPLWCGQNASGCRDVPAAELTRGFFA
ncbi:MAG: nitronate monooxygenase [Caldimonas sp.]